MPRNNFGKIMNFQVRKKNFYKKKVRNISFFLVETQLRCNHRWTMEKSQILHHWTLFSHGHHMEYHSHLGHFCTPHQYWQLWKLPCQLRLQNCTSSMGLKSLLTWLNWLQNLQLLKEILVRILCNCRDQFWWWLRCVLANFHPHLSRLHLKRRWRCSEMVWFARLSRPPMMRLLHLHLRCFSPESSLPENKKRK